jgi:tetratricopeptide (TPR) repeat protein
MNGLKLMARAIALQPAVALYHANMGELLRLMGRLPEAENSLRAAVQLAPGEAGYMSALGLILAQQGKVAEGIQVCRTAAQNAKTAVAYFRLGLILAQQKQYAEARGAYEAALALDPNFGPAQAALRQLPNV